MPDPQDPEAVLEARALALLARREYSRVELARRLAQPPAVSAARRRPRAADFAPPAGSAWPDPADEFAPPPPRRFDPADEFAPPPPHRSAPGGGFAAGSGDDGAEGETSDLHPLQARHIEAVLDRLAARGLLSDVRAAEAIVHAHGRQRGLMRVRQELAQRGVPAEVADQALAGLREQQLPLAREVWRKRFGSLPVDAAERARQTRFLASRGFSFEVIRAVLGGDPED